MWLYVLGMSVIQSDSMLFPASLIYLMKLPFSVLDCPRAADSLFRAAVQQLVNQFPQLCSHTRSHLNSLTHLKKRCPTRWWVGLIKLGRIWFPFDSSWEWLQDINLTCVAYKDMPLALEHFIVEYALFSIKLPKYLKSVWTSIHVLSTRQHALSVLLSL